MLLVLGVGQAKDVELKSYSYFLNETFIILENEVFTYRDVATDW